MFIKVTALDRAHRKSEVLLNTEDISTIMRDMAEQLRIPQTCIINLRSGNAMMVEASFNTLSDILIPEEETIA